jgi:hypothetical protein
MLPSYSRWQYPPQPCRARRCTGRRFPGRLLVQGSTSYWLACWKKSCKITASAFVPGTPLQHHKFFMFAYRILFEVDRYVDQLKKPFLLGYDAQSEVLEVIHPPFISSTIHQGDPRWSMPQDREEVSHNRQRATDVCLAADREE